MKRTICVLTAFVLATAALLATQMGRYPVVIGSDRGPRTGVTLSNTVSRLGTTPATIVIEGNWAIGNSFSVPTNITLQVLQGGRLTVAAAQTLTVNGTIDAGHYRIFYGAGTIDGSAKMIYRPTIWGPAAFDVGDGTIVDDGFFSTNDMTDVMIQWAPNLDTNKTDDVTGLVGTGGGTVGDNGDGTWNVNFPGAASPNLVTGALQIGSIVMWPSNAPPAGFFECNGATITTNGVNSNLFHVIGWTFGPPGGATNVYTLPDLRGCFVRGWNHGRSTGLYDPDAAARTDRGDGTGGDVIGSKQEDGNKSHTHQITLNHASPSGIFPCSSTYTLLQQGLTTTASGGNESRPNNIQLMYIIRY